MSGRGDDVHALVKRLGLRASKAGRPDDADENVIRKRIEVYERETAPVLKLYDPALITDIDADQHPLAVLRDVAGCLCTCISADI